MRATGLTRLSPGVVRAVRLYVLALLGRCPHCGSTDHTTRTSYPEGWRHERTVCNACGRTVRGY